MGRPTGWSTEQTGRPAMRSPGRPPAGRREHRVRFWAAIARGCTSEAAGIEAGVSAVVGVRWFREGGGMPSVTMAVLSGRYLSFAEREEIALLRAQDCGCERSLAGAVGLRRRSRVSCRRNAGTRTGRLRYRASTAQWHADRRARRAKPAKLAVIGELRRYVQDRLSGAVQQPDGAAVPGPMVPGGGRRYGRRKDRRWAQAWSPEQISNRLRCELPDDESMHIAHEAIYQSLYVQGRGTLRRELTACLRTGRALRVPRARAQRGKNFVTHEVMISERPAEAEDRAVPGHWEGDLILGLGQSAIGTLVERSSRFTMLLHLPPPEERQPRVKNGPPVSGHGAEAVRDAITDAILTLPQQLQRSVTWDQGAEMAQHPRLRIDAGVQVYFCDPQSPWQRGTSENSNGLLRQYFPRGTDLARHSAEDLVAVRRAGWPATQDARLEPPRRGAGRIPPLERPDTSNTQLTLVGLRRGPKQQSETVEIRS
jgi:IS30 family transposase